MKNTTLHWAALLAACAWPVAAQAQDGGQQGHSRHGGGSLGQITPYIEADQVVASELEPGDDTVTYTSVAAGVDATITGRNSGGSVSLRYERRFGEGNNTQDSDTVSGVARASLAVVLVARGHPRGRRPGRAHARRRQRRRLACRHTRQ